jgi:DNA-binding CsgD family transcriptional regulator
MCGFYRYRAFADRAVGVVSFAVAVARKGEGFQRRDPLAVIGRLTEVAAIERFLGAIVAGSRCLLLEGEVGIGKTALLRSGSEAAAGRGYVVLSANPVELEVPWEFGALADLLEGVPQAVLDVLPPAQRRAVGVAVFRDEPPEIPVDPRTIATAVLTILRRCSETSPVLLVIDDLPWLDAPSARVLSFVLRRVGDTAVGMLAAVRTGWSGDPAALATDDVADERVEHLRLGPLSLGALDELVTSRTSQNLGHGKLLRLQEMSRGNPLFALQLIAGGGLDLESGSRDHGPVPASLRRLLLTQLSALPASARDLLLLSALTGDPTTSVVLKAAADPQNAADGFDVVWRAGIVEQHGDAITFAHPLVRSVVADSATAEQRREAHRRLADVVRHPEARARHLALAAQGRDEAVAAEAEQAAWTAAGRGACDTAAVLAGLAVSLTPTTQVVDRHRRTALQAEYLFEAPDPAGACALLEAIISDIPPGPPRADLLRRLARYLAFQGDPMTAWTPRLMTAMDEAGDDPALRAAIILDLAVAASFTGNQTAIGRYGTVALEVVEHAGDRALQAQIYAWLAVAAFWGGEGARTDLIDLAMSGAPQPPRLSMELRPASLIGHLLHLCEDLDGARASYEQEYQRAIGEGVETGLPLLLWGLVETEAWAGNWERAEQLCAEGCELAEDTGHTVAIGLMSAMRALMHVYRGRIDEARQEAERVIQFTAETGMPHFGVFGASVLGLAELSVGDPAAAHAHLASWTKLMPAAEVVEPSLRRFLPDDIEALIRIGELDAAGDLLGPFQASAIELGRQWGQAVSGRCEGLLLAARGEMVAAEATLDRAIDQHRQVPMPFELARTLLIAGEVHRRARHKKLAKSALDEAAAIFGRLGSPCWEQRAREELRRLGLRRAVATAADSALTPAEERVADLVASGLTNADVAAQLFMGQRTVEAHLTKIYTKLGVHSRTQLSLVRPTASPAPLRAARPEPRRR